MSYTVRYAQRAENDLLKLAEFEFKATGETRATDYLRLMLGKLGESPKMNPFMRDQVELILKRPPAWNEGTADYYGWYHGTYALFHFGGKAWKAWNASMKPALFAAQMTDKASHEHGSFSTDSAWSVIGGRAYCTAIAALTLEVYLER